MDACMTLRIIVQMKYMVFVNVRRRLHTYVAQRFVDSSITPNILP